MSNVFISYSRKDEVFVRSLHEALEARDMDAWVDYQDIPRTAVWWDSICKAIDATDTFVFVISPDSVASEVCTDEINYALENNKRIVPIVYRDTDNKQVHEKVRAINYIFFRQTDDHTTAFYQLVEAINTDLDWVQQHSRLLERAKEWHENKGRRAYLLRGEDLREAEQWRDKAGLDSGRQPNFLQMQYITASRKWASTFRNIISSAITIGFVVAVVLAIAAFLSENEARAQGRISDARALAANAVAELEADPERSILLATEAISTTLREGEPVVPQAEEALHRALFTSQVRQTLKGHTDFVVGVNYSPDGRNIVTASRDGTAKIWDAQTGRELQTLEGHLFELQDIAFSPDQKIVTAVGDNATLKQWDVQSKQPVSTLRPFGTGSSRIYSLSYNQDGTRIATASIANSDQVQIWNPDNNQVLLSLNGHEGYVLDVSYSPDGKYIVSAGADGLAKVWDAVTGQEQITLRGHTDRVVGTSYSPDGRSIVTASWDKVVKVWDPQTGQVVRDLVGHADKVRSAVYSPDGTNILSAGWDQTAIVWDVETGNIRYTLRGHTNKITKAVYSPDGRQIATADENGIAKLWNTKTGQEEATIQASTEDIRSLVYSSDSLSLATVGVDGLPRIWDVQKRQILSTLEGQKAPVVTAMYSPDGQSIVTSSIDHTARIWDARSGKMQRTLRGHSDGVYSAAYSPDGNKIVTASNDSTVKIWDARTGVILFTPEPGTVGMLKASFSPDGRYVASTAIPAVSDRTAITRSTIWDAQTGKIIHTLEGHTDGVGYIEYSPNGQYLVTASMDHTAKIWDAKTGKELFTLDGHLERVNSATFTSDSRFVLTSGADVSIKVWDVTTGRLYTTLNGHKFAVLIARSSPDGHHIVSAGGDHTAKIWNARSGAEGLSFEVGTQVNGVTYSPDGQHIVTSGADEAIIWNAVTGQRIISLKEDVGDRALYSPDGQAIVTSDGNGSAVWDVKAWKKQFKLVGFSPRYCHQGKWIITSAPDRKGAYIWDAQTGEKVASLDFDGITNAGATSVDCSPDGLTAVTGSGPMGSNDIKIIIWDAQTQKPRRIINGHQNPIFSTVYSPDGRSILTASMDGTAKVWDLNADVETPRLTLVGHTQGVTSATYSSDGRYIVTTSYDGTAKIWDAQTGGLRTTLIGEQGFLIGASFRADGRTLVVADLTGNVRQYLVDINDLLKLARCRVTRELTVEEQVQFLNKSRPTATPEQIPEVSPTPTAALNCAEIDLASAQALQTTNEQSH